jgi:hypothetical protein
MGIPAGTILSRAKREHWSAQIQTARAIVPTASNAPTIAPADDGKHRGRPYRNRLTGARAAHNALQHAASLPEADALSQSRNVKGAIGAASIVHGWNSQSPVAIRVNVGGLDVMSLLSRLCNRLQSRAQRGSKTDAAQPGSQHCFACRKTSDMLSLPFSPRHLLPLFPSQIPYYQGESG